MYKQFNSVIKFKNSSNIFENYEIALSRKEIELEAIKKMFEFSKSTKDGREHSDYIESYIYRFQKHIHRIKGYKEILKSNADKLLAHLTKEEIDLNEIDISLSINSDRLYFFKFLEFDEFLSQQTYMIIEVIMNKKKYCITQSAIGFTEKKEEELANEPTFIHKQIEKFSTLENQEEITKHREYCERLVMNLYGAKDIDELYRPENDSLVDKLIGKPILMLRNIRKAFVFFSIRNCLPDYLVVQFDEYMQKLIETECSLYRKESFKDIFNDEQYENYCVTLSNRKEELMKQLSVEQNVIDEYIKFIPKSLIAEI